MKKETGFTLIEILVVITIIATLAGLVTIIIPTSWGRSHKMVCGNNIRQVIGVLESADRARYPDQSGPNMLLWLVARGQIAGQDMLETLFCPGDEEESLQDAGGVAAYADLDLKKTGEYGHLTSYAARDQKDKTKRAKKGAIPPVILIADDSEDHHDNKGIMIGLTGGVAKWRDKLDDYGMSKDHPLIVGEDSSIEELACLTGD